MKKTTLILCILVGLIGVGCNNDLPGEQYLGRIDYIRYVPVGNGDTLQDTKIGVNGIEYHIYGRLDIIGKSNAYVYHGFREDKEYLRFVGLNRIESVHIIWKGK